MGVGAGLYMYDYDVVIKKFTFTISPPDEFLISCVTQKYFSTSSYFKMHVSGTYLLKA